MKIGVALRASPNDIFGPTPPERVDQPCPVSRSGRCLLDLMDRGGAPTKGIIPENYTPRQFRLLRRFMWFLNNCGPDIQKGLDVLSANWIEGAPRGRRAARTKSLES
jgi:hypothetical protein